ncbi:MotA/TolQ/ExbB proton channel family protein [Labilibacter marinus]|uniref:MotA/TolQ/ExbB proton channel family protein n=1 Tax=Labilibacter marinus TaxID=1477105 RepID=UPI00094FF2E9|nr:MotA/TolQ/ExbB proton channel family protein [Labilibacter marinus]
MLKQIKELFYLGGIEFMVMLTILLIITTAWLIYHFVLAHYSKKVSSEKVIRRLGYGKIMGLFTLVFGICGSMLGLYSMFLQSEIITESGIKPEPELVFDGISVSMIVTIYGLLIYSFSLLFCFIAIKAINKKQLSS